MLLLKSQHYKCFTSLKALQLDNSVNFSNNSITSVNTLDLSVSFLHVPSVRVYSLYFHTFA